jgi:small-conductance mechanosensitive channel
MTHDDWKIGMQNEADSVDTDWSRDTRRHLRRRQLARTALTALLATTAALTLGTQWSVMTREAARNGVDSLTFLKWNLLGNSQPVTTITSSQDPQLPILGLILTVFMLAAVATRLRVPRWITLLCAALGTITISSLGNLILSDFAGFPAYPLSVALGVAALGIVLGLPLRHPQPTRTLA